MERLFPTHHIRKSDPAPALWTLTVLDQDMPPVKALVPAAWELIPALHNYRGRAVYETQITAGGGSPAGNGSPAGGALQRLHRL